MYKEFLINAYYIKLIYKALYIYVKVLYFNLINKEHLNLFIKFNNKNLNLIAMVIMYNVTS
jgi:hypothetical protein